jgi:hypothetical protein
MARRDDRELRDSLSCGRVYVLRALGIAAAAFGLAVLVELVT